MSELHAYRVSVHGDLYKNAERKEGSGCESGKELIAHSGLSTDRDRHPETTERRHAAVLNMYSDKKVEELMNKMLEYLKDHPIYELMELVASAIATVEQKQKETEVK